MHSWRIPAALLLFWHGLLGELPPLFWIIAGVGAMLAILYAATLLGRQATPGLYRRISVVSFVDVNSRRRPGPAFRPVERPTHGDADHAAKGANLLVRRWPVGSISHSRTDASEWPTACERYVTGQCSCL